MERPIIFNTEMVKAILDGRKTMTRRVIKTGDSRTAKYFDPLLDGWPIHQDNSKKVPCPYGQVGDRLWVRETHYRFGMWVKNGFTKTGKQAWRFKPSTNEIDTIRYFDNPPEGIVPNFVREKWGWFKRPSIFMPRWASRLTLEITEVRVERLQEITEEDFLREGGWKCCEGICGEGTMAYGFGEGDKIIRGEFSLNHKDEFSKLWDTINGKKYPWSSNPWVWVIKFDNIGVRVK